jgi:hypothetical protein
VVFEPLDLVAKLAALVTPPRFNLVRYHGVLAPVALETGNRACKALRSRCIFPFRLSRAPRNRRRFTEATDREVRSSRAAKPAMTSQLLLVRADASSVRPIDELHAAQEK